MALALFEKLLDRSYKNTVQRLAFERKEAKNNFIRGIGDLENLECFICGATAFDKLAAFDRYGFEYPTGFCQSCGNLQQISYYSAKDLEVFYSHYYRDIYENRTPEALFSFQRKTSGKKIGEFLENNHCGPRVLEIGCGAGGILHYLKDCGFEVFGTDFDKRYLNLAASKGLKVSYGGIDSVEGTFDVIIVNHVLEHIVNPKKFLNQLKPHLNSSGFIFIEVPTLESISGGAYGSDLMRFFQNAHVCHYSRSHLIRLCLNSGLIKIAAKNDMFLFSPREPISRIETIDSDKLKSLQINLLQKIEKRRTSISQKLLNFSNFTKARLRISLKWLLSALQKMGSM